MTLPIKLGGTKQEQTETLSKLQEQIGQWSHANFGDNESKHPPFQFHFEPVPLFSICSLLGVVEEVGELAAEIPTFQYRGHIGQIAVASMLDDRPDMYENPPDWLTNYFDAIGDIGVYLCDFTYREEISLAQCWNPVYLADQCNSFPRLMQAVGGLCHIVLKRHQGIRGYDNDNHYHSQILGSVQEVLTILQQLSLTKQQDFLGILSHTWERVVVKRNWKANPQAGTATNGREGESATELPLCHGARDGECIWTECPQLRDGEPVKTGRHCPLDVERDEDYLSPKIEQDITPPVSYSNLEGDFGKPKRPFQVDYKSRTSGRTGNVLISAKTAEEAMTEFRKSFEDQPDLVPTKATEVSFKKGEVKHKKVKSLR